MDEVGWASDSKYKYYLYQTNTNSLKVWYRWFRNKYERAKMAGVTKVEIKESVEELHELLLKQKTASSRERIQAL